MNQKETENLLKSTLDKLSRAKQSLQKIENNSKLIESNLRAENHRLLGRMFWIIFIAAILIILLSAALLKIYFDG